MPKEQILAQYQPHQVGDWLRDNEQLRVTLNEYRGRTYLGLRVWYLTAENEWAPGKNGISVPLEYADALNIILTGALASLATKSQ